MQYGQLLLGLDPFGGDLAADVHCELYEGSRQRPSGRVPVKIAGEVAVELDDVRLQTKYVPETRIARPCVIHCDAHSDRSQRRQRSIQAVVLLDRGVLGQLEGHGVRYMLPDAHPRSFVDRR